MKNFKISATLLGGLLLAVILMFSACSRTEISSDLATQPAMLLDIDGQHGSGSDIIDCGCPHAPRITTGVEITEFRGDGTSGGFIIKVNSLSDCDYTGCELSSKCGCVERYYSMQFVTGANGGYSLQDFQLSYVRDHSGNALNYEVIANNHGISTNQPFIAKFDWIMNGPAIVPQAASVASGGICIIDVLPDPNPTPDPNPIGVNQ